MLAQTPPRHMNSSRLVVVIIATAFLIAGAMQILGGMSTIRSARILDFIPVAIGVGLLLRARVAHIAALVYCVIGAAITLPFLWVVLTSTEPRTFTSGNAVLPPAMGYLLVTVYLGAIALVAIGGLVGLLSKSVRAEFKRDR